MGDTLFGRERSGTPIETRGATSDMARMFQQMIRSQMGSGFQPGRQGIDAAADITAGFGEAMRPFEDRETARQVAGMREMFGTAGGRFGSSILQGETELRGELGNQFARARLEAMLQALAPVLGAEQQQLATMAGFLAPGAPQFQQGIFGDLLGAGGMALGAFAGRPGGGGGGGNFTGRLRSTPGVFDPNLFGER
jgi:hypothetical protein